MKTSRPVVKLTAGPSIHTYFDVILESPDRRHITYFTIGGKPSDHGTVFIAERDGTEPGTVKSVPGSPHGGACRGWLDNGHIYFQQLERYTADLEGY
jgi:hypothetical protein